MPQPKIHLPEIVIAARRRYVEGEAVEPICADLKISTGSFYKYLAGNVPDMTLPPIPRRRPDVRRLRPAKSVRLAVVKRLWHVAEQQLREIDRRLAAGGQPAAERSRDVRELAGLVRSLRELAALDERDAEAAGKSTATHDDECNDIDQFRRDLVRQMDAIVARRANGGSGQPDGS